MSKMKIELTEQEVRTAIADYINNHYNWVNDHVYDDDVKLEIGRSYYQRSMRESTPRESTPVFKKAVITINESE